MRFEEFHITRSESSSTQTVARLAASGVRLREYVNADGEYVIEVHEDDLEQASHAFWDDVTPVISVTSGTKKP